MWCSFVQFANSKVESSDAGSTVDTTIGTPDAQTSRADAGDSAPSVDVSVNATIGGHAFNAAGAAANHFWFEADGGGPGNGGMSLLIGQYPAMCSAPRVPLSQTLFFYLRSNQSEVVPGSYPIVEDVVLGGRGPGLRATLNVVTLYADDCGISNADQATSGSATVTKNTGGGTFDAVLSRNGAVQGTFRIVECARWDPRADDGTAKCVL